eukprot:snap_masked-scaffold_2-processed-gene-1.26-mRNA-1 protein AED:0.54 eAED:0.54 QI:0/-1/0/1/-1/1/1/0/168
MNGMLFYTARQAVRLTRQAKYLEITMHGKNYSKLLNCRSIMSKRSRALNRTRGLSTSIDEAEFHDISDRYLEDLELAFEDLETMISSDFDLTNSQGVLTLQLGSDIFVINKQTPNRQIWVSSPLSGPLRFNYNSGNGFWEDSRKQERLENILEKDISALTNLDYVVSV